MFDVFVEGAVDASPDAMRRLADTMAVKFGLAADDLVARLVRGRVRVKARVDRATADAYVRELNKIGAKCVVEDARPTTQTPPAGVPVTQSPPVGSGRATPPSRAELLRGSTPPAGTRATTPPTGSRSTTPPPRTSSGLSAAVPGASRPTPPSGLAAAASSSRPPPPSGLSAARAASTTDSPTGYSMTRKSSSTGEPPTRTSSPSGGYRTTPAVGSSSLGNAPAPSPQRPVQRAQSVSTSPVESRTSTIATAGMPQQRPPAPLVAATFRTPQSIPVIPSDGGEPPPSPPLLSMARTMSYGSLPSAPSNAVPSSGLSAASGHVESNLGALAQTGPISLSSIDGKDAFDAARVTSAFGPVIDLDTGISGEPGKLANRPDDTPSSKPSQGRPKDEPLDLFAPPDADDGPASFDLAPDDVDHQARQRTSMPPPIAEAAPPPTVPVGRPSGSSAAQSRPGMPAAASLSMAASSAALPSRGKLGPLADVRIRFAAGVLVAILIGFMPAMIVASIRERSAFKSVDDSYIAATMEPAPAADVDDVFLDKKRSARRGIAVTSLLIWAVGGGAVAYVWFRRVPWNRWA